MPKFDKNRHYYTESKKSPNYKYRTNWITFDK